MDKNKYSDIAKKLIRKSENQTFTVISDSMAPLIRKNDKIICRSVSNIKSIRKYSIIAFNNDINDRNVATVHRVLKFSKNKQLIKTKGDANLFFDKTDVTENILIGLVYCIIRNGRELNLESFCGRFLSVYLYFFSALKNYLNLLLSKIKNLAIKNFIPEPEPKYDDSLSMLRLADVIPTKSWIKTSKINSKILENFMSSYDNVCDISFDGGLCEESFYFIRNLIPVDNIKINSPVNKKYKFIICSKILNLAQNENQRKEIYAFIKKIIAKDGKVFLSYINVKNNFGIYLKRTFFSFFKLYKGPSQYDIINKGFFVMKYLKSDKVESEFSENKFKVINKTVSEDVVTFVLEVL